MSEWAIAGVRSPWQTCDLMWDIDFSVRRYKNRVPILATCLRCQLKFLTPKAMMEDARPAKEYLLKKYREHQCVVSSVHISTFAPKQSRS